LKRKIVSVMAAAALMALSPAANAASYKEITVSNGGTLTGSVSAGSNQTEVKTFTISKDPQICGTGTREVPFVQVNNGMLQNAVVFLYKVKEGKAFPEGLDKMTIEQKGCEFHPFLGFMQNKGELTVVNSDPTLHNIHTYEQIGKARRTVLNVSQPNKGDVVTKKIKLRKGDAMKVECDAHDFMHAFIFVAKNPYYAKVDDNGHYEITDIPPGKYKVKVWHGALGEIDAGEVEISAGQSVTLDASY